MLQLLTCAIGHWTCVFSYRYSAEKVTFEQHANTHRFIKVSSRSVQKVQNVLCKCLQICLGLVAKAVLCCLIVAAGLTDTMHSYNIRLQLIGWWN